MFREKIIIEGTMPERALSRLQRAGICVYHAKKIKKNQILLSVKRKDSEKVFAIYPNLCYNISVYGAYTAKSAGEEGAGKFFDALKKRAGLFIGGAVFLAGLAFCQGCVFRIDITGSSVYRREALAALEESGIKLFSRYPEGKEGEICAKLLALPEVSYCSVKKKGTAVTVEMRLSAFSSGGPQEGDMLSKHSGRIVEMAVLRGTPLKKIGDETAVGESLVGAYLLSASGEGSGGSTGEGSGNRTPVTAIARVTIYCSYEEIIETDSEEAAFARAYLNIGGDGGEISGIAEKSVSPVNGGYLVKIGYTVAETINF